MVVSRSRVAVKERETHNTVSDKVKDLLSEEITGKSLQPYHRNGAIESDSDDDDVTQNNKPNGVRNTKQDSPEEKDDVEEELERLVFGDSAGFRDGIQEFGTFSHTTAATKVEGVKAEDSEHFQDLVDDDIFFTDVQGSGAPLESEIDGPFTNEDDESEKRHPPAWEDSDDERLVVSLASVPRLRKLRRTEAEDVVSGREYMRRLRKQYTLLHPVPDWVSDAAQQTSRKRRKFFQDGLSDDSSVNEMDLDNDDDLSIEPLGALLRDASSLVSQSGGSRGKKRKLRPEILEINRTKDIEPTQPSAVTSLSFHSSLPLLLSSGPSSTLYLHHITPSPPATSPNPLLTSLHLKSAPLSTTSFHPTDSRIFLSSRRRYFHVWDLPTGQVRKVSRIYGQQHEQRTMENFKLSPDGKLMALEGSSRKGGGVINLLDTQSLQWVNQVRAESRGGIADFAWWNDSRGLSVVGKNGEVSEWDLASQSVVERWSDEGAVGTTVIALGGHNGQAGSRIGTDRWVAIGSSSGIVNIYDRRAWLLNSSSKQTKSTNANDSSGEAMNQVVPTKPKPSRTLEQLTTPTSHLHFSPDGQMLVFASRWKKDALRIVHLPSCTVFKNWPTSNTPLGRVTGVAFGPNSDLLAVANEAGKIRMWEIQA